MKHKLSTTLATGLLFLFLSPSTPVSAKVHSIHGKIKTTAAKRKNVESGATAESTTLVAKQALTLFTSGAKLLALENLFAIENPTSIASEVKAEWRSKLSATDPILRQAQVKWTNAWTQVFTPAVANAYAAWQTKSLKKENDFKNAQSLASKLDPESDERAWVDWQIALGRGINNQTQSAIEHLQALLDSKQELISEDEILMAVARMMFQDGKFKGALHFYDSVSKGSDLWLEAIEEKAWAFMRQNDYEKALSQFHTLMTPVFAPQVGPEPYFMGSLADLKICDYNSIFKILKDFKNKYNPALPELEKLAKTGESPYLTKAIAKLEKGSVSWAALGSDVNKIPRLFNRDVTLLKSIDRRKEYEKELAVVKAGADPGANSAVNTNVSFDQRVVALAEKHIAEAKNEIVGRTKQLAANDLKDLTKILQKLRIIEVEAMQRIGTDQKTAKKTEVDPAEKRGEVLSFPKEDEVWLDEVTHYEVTAKGCPTKGGHIK